MTLELSLKKAKKAASRKGVHGGISKGDEFSLETIMEDVTTTLNKVAEQRRGQVNSNKSNQGQSHPGDEKRKSFHQKMLRRRITTMLRPSYSTMLADVKEMAKQPSNTRANDDCFDICDNNEGISPELRAEELLLLSLHPESANHPLPPVPDQSDPNLSWAEPGWQIILDNPEHDKRRSSSSILPTDNEGHLTQLFLSSCCSSGRQAASLIKSRHLRMLTAPLSSACQASAPAETDPSGQKKASEDVIDFDPLSMTDEKMRGYSFVVKPTTQEPVVTFAELAPEKSSGGGMINDAVEKSNHSSSKKRKASKKSDAKDKTSTKKRKSHVSTKKHDNSQAVPQNQTSQPPMQNISVPVPRQSHQMNANQQQAQQQAQLQQAQQQAQLQAFPQQPPPQQEQFQHLIRELFNKENCH